MTPEQVAHARATLSQDWDYPTKRVITKDNVRLLLDAIESAWQERDTACAALSAMTAERDALREQLAARVVVPEMTPEVAKDLWHGSWARHWINFADGMMQGIEWSRKNAKALDPATECVVGREEYNARKRHTKLLREVVEDLSKFDSPEMRRITPRTVESIQEFVSRADAALAALREGRE